MPYHELGLDKRIRIRVDLLQSLRAIAKQLKRVPFTASCEVRRNSASDGIYNVGSVLAV
ncbi:hypothetical protein VQ643_16230 [Pseudomonas sp. F1_0610]|uniref:hypothetical protein n=1 Tax=Pseudomonas sp. F1_0610 TaxID=3114284 RepID=UPI0039C31041